MNYFTKNLFIIILLPLIFSASSAQVVVTSRSYALIFPRSGDGFAANIIRVEKDSLVVFTNDYKYIAKKDVAKLILRPNKESGKGFTLGSILGIYAMNYWLGTASGQPGAFLWNEPYGSKYSSSTIGSSSLIVGGIALLGVVVGGGLGYLFEGGDANAEVMYLFGSAPEIQEAQWAKLQDAIDHKATHGKWHLTIAGSIIFPEVSNAYLNQITEAGYSTNTFGSSRFNFFGGSSSNGSDNLAAYQNLQIPTDFNWLRSISLSYSVSDEIQAGLCYALLGQPSFVYSKQSQLQDSTGGFSTGTAIVGQRLDGKGYYATAGYYKYFGKNDDLEVLLSAGLGLAKINFDLNGQFDFNSSLGFNTNQQNNVSVHKTYFSAMISAGLSYYLYDSFSIGVKTDYFYVGTSSARGMPFVSLHDQDLNFSTADIGFTIGLHF